MNVVSFGGRGTPGKPDNLALPSNSEAEQAFLGALLVQNDVYVHIAGFLIADHFYAEINRRIFEIASKMIGEGRLASPITIRPFLGEHDMGVGMTIPGYLARLAAEAVAPIAARDYALCIRDLAVRRDMLKVARDLEEQAFDAPVDMRPAEIASGALDRLAALAEDPSTTKRVSAGASAARLVARAQEIMSGAEVASGVSTGFSDLDDATGGYRPGALWIVAGRPGMGKSIVGGTSATKVANKGHGVLVFSLELAEEEFAARLLADLSYSARRPIAFSQIMRGALDDEELWTISDAQRRLERMPITVDYSSRLSAAEIKARIHVEGKRLRAQGKGLGVVFIDYLKFVAASDRYKGNRVYEVGEISAAMKAAAKDEGVCIVLLAQLNRALESREDKRPGLSDLRESGDLEADADVVAFIHRDHYYLEKSSKVAVGDDRIVRLEETRNQADLIIGKNRSGPCRTIPLFCNVGCSTMATRSDYVGEAGF